MSETSSLLVEIGTEELPPLSLQPLSQALAEGFSQGLKDARLGHGPVERFATPRRLALRIRDLAARQPERAVERKGPALKAAFDAEGRPTRAAEGFARSCGVAVADLDTQETPKGAWLVFRKTEPGRPARQLIPDILQRALDRLPIPKRMRWGDLDPEFVRPVHWVVVLLDEEVIPCEILSVRAANATHGHRFHHPGALGIARPGDYDRLLREEGRVEPDFSRRREIIREQVTAAAREAGGEARIDPGLLDEVTALTEWPVAITGGFEPRFLEVPPEVLVQTMQKHQKYFPVVDADDRLLPRFITVANIESRDPSKVRAGNERVIRPRFEDAAFFWHQDLQIPFERLGERLGEVVYQKGLGSMRDRVRRIRALAEHLAGHLGLNPDLAARAADLCKNDLLSQMVNEFPGLQGTMGRYYAQAAGEDACVAAAMEEQYLPRHAGDRLPETPCGRVLALADRLEALAGNFAIGNRPSGVRDPFGLRRAALGLVRILIETPLDLDLAELSARAAEEMNEPGKEEILAQEVFAYCMERLHAYYRDRGIGSDRVDAVLASGATRPYDIHRRIAAVDAFLELPEAARLVAANKRIRNILRKAGEKPPEEVDPGRFTEAAEADLYEAVERIGEQTRAGAARGDYQAVLTAMAGLADPVDRFFDDVMVMDEDPKLRANRLALLQRLYLAFLQVADVGRLQPEN